MIHLFVYSIKEKLRNFEVLFWPLVFPLILGTLFYFGFGRIEEADFETVSVAVVESVDGKSDPYFLDFLDQIEAEEGTKLIKTNVLSESEALTKLKDQQISGIYYAGETPALTVSKQGLAESILQSLLESYISTSGVLMQIEKQHPEGMGAAMESLQHHYETQIMQVSLDGKSTDSTAQFFYALIAMACLYGGFLGLMAALHLQANLSALAARRSVSPTHKLKIILVEYLSSFAIHYVNVLILLAYLKFILKLEFNGNGLEMMLISLIGSMIGVALGIFIGSLGTASEGIKVGILLGVSMTGSFLAGLMNSNMRDIVERHAPIINRINPAALITDAFYCINIYNSPQRYQRNLITLLIFCGVLTVGSFLVVRRERYDSI